MKKNHGHWRPKKKGDSNGKDLGKNLVENGLLFCKKVFLGFITKKHQSRLCRGAVGRLVQISMDVLNSDCCGGCCWSYSEIKVKLGWWGVIIFWQEGTVIGLCVAGIDGLDGWIGRNANEDDVDVDWIRGCTNIGLVGRGRKECWSIDWLLSPLLAIIVISVLQWLLLLMVVSMSMLVVVVVPRRNQIPRQFQSCFNSIEFQSFKCLG